MIGSLLVVFTTIFDNKKKPHKKSVKLFPKKVSGGQVWSQELLSLLRFCLVSSGKQEAWPTEYVQAENSTHPTSRIARFLPNISESFD